ncbi:hypothetical protein [Zhihengliuella halotolerans]|uniref:hypothetical protein n=1 Tax=Zhihengliuella halotolerans TaxID=370736 RepID=UPI000C805A40|nr:hypothetical protein [Zhihengliuella halotolerans]
MSTQAPDFALYSPEEISEMMRGKLSAWSLRKLARDKAVECVRINGGRILFTAAQVERLLEEWTQSPKREPVAPEVALAFEGSPRARRLRGL